MLLEFPEANCFHTAGWARVLHESYGYRPRYFASRRDGRIAALLPVMEVSIAASIFLHFGGQVMFKYGASDPRHQQLRPNYLVMWEAIRTFAAEGRRDLHMGRNEAYNPGLRRYKLSWGCREGLLGYRRFCPGEGVFSQGKNPQQGMAPCCVPPDSHAPGAARRLPDLSPHGMSGSPDDSRHPDERNGGSGSRGSSWQRTCHPVRSTSPLKASPPRCSTRRCRTGRSHRAARAPSSSSARSRSGSAGRGRRGSCR